MYSAFGRLSVEPAIGHIGADAPSVSGWMRQLFELGHRLSAGVVPGELGFK